MGEEGSESREDGEKFAATAPRNLSKRVKSQDKYCVAAGCGFLAWWGQLKAQ